MNYKVLHWLCWTNSNINRNLIQLIFYMVQNNKETLDQHCPNVQKVISPAFADGIIALDIKHGGHWASETTKVVAQQ